MIYVHCFFCQRKKKQKISDDFDHDDANDDERSYEVGIQFVKEINLNEMKHMKRTMALEQMDALNHVLRNHLSGTHLFYPSSCCSFDKRSAKSFTDTLDSFDGFYQSIKASTDNAWLLNVDCKLNFIQFVFDCNLIYLKKKYVKNIFFFMTDMTGFFLKIMSVMEFLKKSNLIRNPNEPFDDDSLKRAKSLLKGIKYNVTHDKTNTKLYTIDGLHLDSTSYFFPGKENQMISVEQHFRENYEPLKYPHLPCLLSKSGPSRMLAFPIEVCQIAKEQRLSRKLSPREQSMQKLIKLDERLEKTKNYIQKVKHFI